MKKIELKVNGKLKIFTFSNGVHSTLVNGYVIKRLIQGNNMKKVFFASFNEKEEILDGSLTSKGIEHALFLLVNVSETHKGN